MKGFKKFMELVTDMKEKMCMKNYSQVLNIWDLGLENAKNALKIRIFTNR